MDRATHLCRRREGGVSNQNPYAVLRGVIAKKRKKPSALKSAFDFVKQKFSPHFSGYKKSVLKKGWIDQGDS